MPKKNKIRVMKNEPKSKSDMKIVISKDDDKRMTCSMCGKPKIRMRSSNSGYFVSNSVLYRGNGGFIPACKQCVRELYSAYKEALGSDMEAAKRVCMKFDVYWSEQLFHTIVDTVCGEFDIGQYLRRIHVGAFSDLTYDATINEEGIAMQKRVMFEKSKDAVVDDDYDVSPEQVVVWGAGLDPLFYAELDAKYSYWTDDLEEEKIDKATETLIRQICMLQVTQSREAAAGKSTEKLAKSIDSLIGSLNLKPVQKKDADNSSVDSETEMTPFGVWIRRIENDRPIPEPEESLEDVDSLREYLQTWFLGGLCSMMRIPNEWSDMFDKAMEEYTVEKPEYDFEDDSLSLDDILEKAEEEGRKSDGVNN